MKRAIIGMLAAAAAVLPACKSGTPATVIARVGNSELTLENAKAHIDTTRIPYTDQLRHYVAHWVNTELIYQEATRAGFDRSEEAALRAEDARRQIINGMFLVHQLAGDTAGLTEDTMRAYFDAHAAEFIVPEDMMKLNVITFSARERANAFSALVSRGNAWNEAVTAIVHDTAAAPGIVSNRPGQFYSQHTLFPGELWKVATTLGTNDISFPVKTVEGYCVLQLLAVAHAGKQATYDLSRDEVRGRLLVERRRRTYAALLGTLHKRYNVEIVLGFEQTTDSTQFPGHE